MTDRLKFHSWIRRTRLPTSGLSHHGLVDPRERLEMVQADSWTAANAVADRGKRCVRVDLIQMLTGCLQTRSLVETTPRQSALAASSR